MPELPEKVKSNILKLVVEEVFIAQGVKEIQIDAGQGCQLLL
jgi:hypothetical protein